MQWGFGSKKHTHYDNYSNYKEEPNFGQQGDQVDDQVQRVKRFA